MVDREMQATGVPAERDQELAVTGVPAETAIGPTTAPVPAAPSPFASPSPTRVVGGGQRQVSPFFTQRDPASGLVSGVRDKDAQYIFISILEMDPSLKNNLELAHQMTSGFIEIADQDPTLYDEFLKKPSLALAHITEDYLKLKTLQTWLDQAGFGEEGDSPWAGKLDALISATEEAYNRREGAIHSAGQLINDMNAARGEFTVGDRQLDELARVTVADEYRSRGTEVGGRVVLNDEDIANAGRWNNAEQEAINLARKIKGRGGEWIADKNGNLYISITEGSGDDEELVWDSLIRLDTGTEVTNQFDALVVLFQAISGQAHKLENPDKVPNQQSAVGLATQIVGGTMRLAQHNPVGRFLITTVEQATSQRSPNAIAMMGTPGAPPPLPTVGGDLEVTVDLKRTEESGYRRDLSMATNSNKANATKEMMIYGAAQILPGEPDERINLAMGIVGSMSPADLEAAQAEASEVNQEELYDRFRKKREERGFLPSALEEHILLPALNFAQLYDSFTQSIAATVIHTLDVDTSSLSEESHRGALQILMEDGFSAFADSYVEIFEKREELSEFLGMDPDTAAAGWVNFLGSVAGDPFTYIAPGAASQRRAMLKAMADPNLVENYVRTNPAFNDLARQLVDDVGKVQLTEIFTAGGMGQDTARRLMDIAITDYGVGRPAAEVLEETFGAAATRAGRDAAFDNVARNEAVEEVRRLMISETPAMGGLWLPAGPSTLQLRQGTLGFGNVFKSFTKLSDKDRNIAYQLLARAQRGRSASISDDGFAEGMLRNITIAAADNSTLYRDEVMRFYDEALKPYAGLVDEMEAVARQSDEAARTGWRNLDEATSAEVRNVPRLRGDVGTMRTRIREIEAALFEARKPGSGVIDNAISDLEAALARIKTGADDATARLADNEELYLEYVERRKDFRHAINNAADLQASARVPRDRGILERYIHGFYDRWAERLEIPLTETDHPFLAGVKLRDWDLVTGTEKSARFGQEIVDNLTPFGAENIPALRAMNVGAATITPLPASPMEMIAYGASQALGDGAWAKVLKGMDAVLESKPLAVQQQLFVTAVLTNLVTPVKTNMDEVLRFWVEVGVRDFPDVMRALVGGSPIVGRFVRNRAPASTRGRLLEGPISSSRPWRVLETGDPGHWQAAERWVNGSLLEDPIFKEYARVMVSEGGDKVAAREAFREWWDSTGAFFANTTSGQGQEITYQTAFDVLDNGFEFMARSSSDAPGVMDRILRAAASNEKIGATNESFWRTLGRVPGEEGLPAFSVARGEFPMQKLHERTFQSLYGTPGSYRGAVIHDNFYDKAMDIYGNSGIKILDVDALMDTGQFVSREQATRALAAGQHDPMVRRMVASQGYRLERDIEMAASRWARNRADDMMYQMGAVSAFGRKTQKLYPFGRAQTDFLNYWFTTAARPLQFRGFAPITTAGGRSVPLNARVYDMWAKLAAQQDPEGQDPAGSPGDLVRRFTFLPTQFDESFLLDVVPSPRPIASWMVNFLPDEPEEGDVWSEIGAAVRDGFSALHPSHQVFSDYSNTGGFDLIRNFIDSTLPGSGRSLRTGVEAAAQAIVALNNVPSSQINGFFNAIMVNGESPYYRDYMAGEAVDWMADENNNIFDIVVGSPSTDLFNKLEQVAFDRSMGQDAFDYLKANIAQQNQAGSDALNIRGYTPMASKVSAWFEAGYFSKGVFDEFNLNYEVVEMFLNKQGKADVADKRRFADAASDIFWNLPDMVQAEFAVDHPEIVNNLISNFEVDMDLAPQELIDDGSIASGRIVLRGEDGREVWRRGFGTTDGPVWIKTRDQEEVWTDKVERAHNYASTYIKGAFETITGVEWEKVTETRGSTPMGALRSIQDADQGLDAETEAAHIERLVDILRVELPDDAINPDGTLSDDITLGELKTAFKEERNRLGGDFTDSSESTRKLIDLDQWASDDTLRILELVGEFGWDFDIDATKGIDYYGSGLVDDLNKTISALRREFDFQWPDEWEDVTLPATSTQPAFEFNAEEARAGFRDRINVAIMLSKDFTLGDYNRDYAKWFGDSQYEEPDPPPVSELENAVTLDDPRDFHVEDGDTIYVYTDDGETVPFRLLGINTVEKHQPGYDESKTALRTLILDAIEQGETITLGTFNPGRYGTTQLFRSEKDGVVTDSERIFAWIYVGDFAVWDPEFFTSLNPRGQATGSGIFDYQGNLDREIREAGE